MFNKFLLILSISGLILPYFTFAQTASGSIELPKTTEEVKQMAQKGIMVTINQLPGAIKQIWKDDVLPLWTKMWDWTVKNILNNYIKQKFIDFWYQTLKPKIQGIIQQINSMLGKEIEKNKPVIKEEFQKSTEQIKKEIPSTTQSLWQKFQNLLK